MEEKESEVQHIKSKRKQRRSIPIDFLGYRFLRKIDERGKEVIGVELRKSLKKRFAIKNRNIKNKEKKYRMQASYKGWCEHGDENCSYFFYKITGMDYKEFKDLGVKASASTKDGHRYFDVPTIAATDILNIKILIRDFETDVKTKNGGGRYAILFEKDGVESKFITNNYKLKNILDQCKEQNVMPFYATLKKRQLGQKIDYYLE